MALGFLRGMLGAFGRDISLNLNARNKYPPEQPPGNQVVGGIRYFAGRYTLSARVPGGLDKSHIFTPLESPAVYSMNETSKIIHHRNDRVKAPRSF